MKRLWPLLVAGIIALTGCGIVGPPSDVITRQQADQAAGNPIVQSLVEANYTVLAITDHRLLLRDCRDEKSPENCLTQAGPTRAMPDVYLDIKEPTTLVPTGTYKLLFPAAKHSNRQNSLMCAPEQETTVLTAATIAGFEGLGNRSHEMEYKTLDGGSSVQTVKAAGDIYVKCKVAYGHYL